MSVHALLRGGPTGSAAVIVALALLVPAGSACRRRPPGGGERHPIAGRVVAVDVANRTITIAHGEIPGVMPGMTMPFVVLERDAAVLSSARPGDQVSATLVGRDSRYWLEGLVVVQRGAPAAGPPARPPRPEAQPGDRLPEVDLIDQDGRRFRLADLRGTAFALTFVYTRCPLPDYCPLLMRQFASAEGLLLADAALRARTRLLTVSFDTRNDTPEVLRAFGARFQQSRPPFAHWSLATGSEPAIRELGEALGLDYIEEEHSFTHNLRTAVVGADGRLRRLFRGNDWKPDQLVAELRQALAR